MPYVDHSDKKRTPKFVGEIQAPIENDHSKLIRSIVRNMEVSKFLIRPVVNKNIQYFSYKMKNGIFILGHEGQKENLCSKDFLTNSSISSNKTCFAFSQMKIILTKLRW